MDFLLENILEKILIRNSVVLLNRMCEHVHIF